MQTHPTRTLSPAFSAWVIRCVRMIAGVSCVLAVAACMTDPAAPLIPTPERHATVLTADVHALDADGYPNVLSDPSSVPGLPRSARSIAASEASLEAERSASQGEVAGIRAGRFGNELARRGRTHAAEAKRAIEATGRPAVPGIQNATLGGTDGQLIAPSSAGNNAVSREPGPARPIDPDAPRPRPVGVPPFRGEANNN